MDKNYKLFVVEAYDDWDHDEEEIYFERREDCDKYINKWLSENKPWRVWTAWKRVNDEWELINSYDGD